MKPPEVIGRRAFLNMVLATSTAAAVGTAAFPQREKSQRTSRINAIAFDGFVIFDPRSVNKIAEEVFPGKGAEFAAEWRTRQFEYAWLRTAANQYADFWRVTEDALVYTAAKFGLSFLGPAKTRLMNSYRELSPWPDVPAALAKLRDRGIRLAFLSNFTAAMLDANLSKARLRDFFGDHLSTDRVSAYKPHPRAYQMGVDAFRLNKEGVAFAAFGAWDAAGAKWFGYPTVWVNRAGVPPEELGARPDVITTGIEGLLKFVGIDP